MKIYLVRHGEVNHNLYKIYSNEDEELNETGIKQAECLKEKIQNLEYDIVISSPLKRAKHTAEIINVKNRNTILDERLKEHDPGNLNGQPLDVTDREEYWNYYSNIQYGTSETMEHLFNKVKDFLDELKTKEYNSVVIVAHSGISKAFYAYFNGIPEDGKFLNLGLKNTEIKEYKL